MCGCPRRRGKVTEFIYIESYYLFIYVAPVFSFCVCSSKPNYEDADRDAECMQLMQCSIISHLNEVDLLCRWFYLKHLL